MTAPATGDYTLSLTHLGTVRLYLDGQVLIDDPGLALRVDRVTRHLVAGEQHDLRIEYAADRPEQAAPDPGEPGGFALTKPGRSTYTLTSPGGMGRPACSSGT